MPIVAKLGDQLAPLGTGFMITPNGLMMTAAHVVQALVPTEPYRPAGPIEIAPTCELYAVWATDNESPGGQFVGGLLPIDKAWFREGLDIALCWLRLPTIDGRPLELPTLRLSPGLPSVCDKVVGFGYRAMSGSVSAQTPDNLSLEYEHSTAVSDGTIEEVHVVSRDRGLLNFPCFRTTAHFAHGMSGGPVFNAAGNVCGVIASGSTFQDDSYASLLWLGLACHLEMAPSLGEALERVTLFDLVCRGAVAVDHTISDVNVEMAPDGSANASVRQR